MANVEIEIGIDVKQLMSSVGQLSNQMTAMQDAMQKAGITISDSFNKAAGNVNKTSVEYKELNENIEKTKKEIVALGEAQKIAMQAKGKGNETAIKDLSTQTELATKKLKEYESQLKVTDTSVKNTTSSYFQLVKQIRELKVQMLEAAKAGDGKMYDALATKAGHLQEQLFKANEAVNQMKPDQYLNNIMKLGRGIGGAFEVAAGAQLVFGEESEEVQKLLQKTMGIMAIMQGMEEVRAVFAEKNLLKSLALQTKSIFYKTVEVAATEAQTAATITQAGATEGATVAQKGLNTAMKANPIAFVIAGVAALVAGTIALYNWLTRSTGAEKALNAARKESIEIASKEIAQSKVLENTLKNTAIGTEARATAIGDINEKYKEYLPFLLTEKMTNEQIHGAMLLVNEQMQKKALNMAVENQLVKAYEEQVRLRLVMVKINDIDDNMMRELAIAGINKGLNEQQEIIDALTETQVKNNTVTKSGAQIQQQYIDAEKRTRENIKKMIEDANKDKTSVKAIKELKVIVEATLRDLENLGRATNNAWKISPIIYSPSETNWEEIETEWIDAMAKAEDEQAEITKQSLEKQKQDRIDTANASIDALQEGYSIFYQFQQQSIENQTNEVNKAYEEQAKALDDKLKKGIISQSEYDKKKAELDKKKAEQDRVLQHKAFEQKRKADVVLATMEEAKLIIALSAAMAMTGNPLAPVIAAATGAIVGAANIGLILAQKNPYAKGGLIGGKSHAEGGTYINAEAGEAVINKRSMENPYLKNLASAINEYGGGKAFGDSSMFSSFIDMMAFNPKSMQQVTNKMGTDVNVNTKVSLSKVPELTEIRDLLAVQGSRTSYIDKNGSRHIITGNMTKIIH